MSSTRNDYFEWLCSIVSAESHNVLLKELFEREFTYDIPRDVNRSLDGRQLRSEFAQACGYSDLEAEDIDPYNDSLESCNVLEVLIGIASRMAFEIEEDDDYDSVVAKYFWEMIHNLKLYRFDDANFFRLHGMAKVHDILSIWMERQFEPDGTGSIFPLKCPGGDQRDEEIWYQMQAYIEENY